MIRIQWYIGTPWPFKPLRKDKVPGRWVFESRYIGGQTLDPLQGKRQANTSMTIVSIITTSYHQKYISKPSNTATTKETKNKERVVVSWSMSPSMHSYPLTVSVHTKPLKITKPKQETWNWSESRWHFVLIRFDNTNQVLVLNISFLYLYSREDSQNLLASTHPATQGGAPTIVTKWTYTIPISRAPNFPQLPIYLYRPFITWHI